MNYRWLYFILGSIAGGTAGAVIRAFFPPVPGWPFRLSLFIAIAGIALLVITGSKLSERAGDLVFSSCMGIYLGYAF